MVTTSSGESDPTANKNGSPEHPVDDAAHASIPSACELDAQLAPLRIPALVLGVVLLALGVVALVPMRAWSRDYGAPLVIIAYLQYLGVAATVAWWGLRTVGHHRDSSRRGRAPDEDTGHHTAGPGGPGPKPMTGTDRRFDRVRSVAKTSTRNRDKAWP